MQEHILQPFESLPCTGSYKKNGQVFKNWDPFVNEAMTLPTALAKSCDTYFYQVGYRFYGMPSDRGPRLQAWASRFGFGQKTGIDLGSERSGLLPTPDWRKKTYTKKTDPGHWAIDSLWKPGDSIQLAIGQKDLLVTPMQMARFYAMIANGGKLVTPHLLQDVEQPSSNGTPGRAVPSTPPPAPEPTNVDAQALAVVREGLYQATHYSFGTSASIFGSFPISISGKTGTAEKSIDPGDGYPPTVQPVLVVRVRPVRLARSRRLRADRKRRPRRRRRCAGRTQGLRILLRQASDRHRPHPQRLMVDHYVSNARAAARARRREAVEVASFVRRLDWLLLGSVAAVVGYGLWAIAGITHHDVTGNPGYYLTRQAVYVFIGVVCLVVAVLVDPELYRTRWRWIFGTTSFLIAIVLLTGPIRGSKRWLDLGFFRFQPSEFGKVLFVLALAGFLAERSRRLNDIRTTLTALGLASIPVFLVFLQPDFGSALVYCAAVFAVLFVAGTPWTHIAALAGGVARPCRAGPRRAPRRRPADSQGLPAAASDRAS